MNPDFVELLEAFAEAEVRFLVVGAYALALHGRPRATGDLDLWQTQGTQNPPPFGAGGLKSLLPGAGCLSGERQALDLGQAIKASVEAGDVLQIVIQHHGGMNRVPHSQPGATTHQFLGTVGVRQGDGVNHRT